MPERLYMQQPFSPEAEAFRTLNTSLTLARGERQHQIILVTSPLPAEGKTTVCTNLATVFSRHGKTCLIDADLRVPRVAKALGLKKREPSAGCKSVLDSLEEVPNLPNLKVLVLADGLDCEPATLFGSEAMRDMLHELRAEFDSIIIDSPPIMPFADARLLSTLADGVVLVCRSGVTAPETLRRSREILREVNSAPLLEVVLNGAAVSVDHYYGYYGGLRAQKNSDGSLTHQEPSAA
jgi:capsular exopolysaccharide synthesis family protein